MRRQIDTAGLAAQVLAGRKGFRNKFQSLLGLRKGPGAHSPEPGSRPAAAVGRYDASSPELQLRALADAAIMLQVPPAPTCSAPLTGLTSLCTSGGVPLLRACTATRRLLLC